MGLRQAYPAQQPHAPCETTQHATITSGDEDACRRLLSQHLARVGSRCMTDEQRDASAARSNPSYAPCVLSTPPLHTCSCVCVCACMLVCVCVCTLSLPGVATTTCGLRASSLACSCMSTPPITTASRNVIPAARALNCSAICIASSLREARTCTHPLYPYPASFALSKTTALTVLKECSGLWTITH